jgi:hypothetical protein
MKKLVMTSIACGATLALVAAGAYAGNGNGRPSPDQLAKNTCATQLHAIGSKAFNGLYGNSGTQTTCQHKNLPQAKSLINNVAQACKAEQADPNFATSHGGLTFDQTYGTNHNQKNAYGKCVSTKAKAQQAANAANIQNAAQLCRAERSDTAFATETGHNGESFADFYGTNKNNRNAFGKCVSGKAKASTPPVT